MVLVTNIDPPQLTPVPRLEMQDGLNGIHLSSAELQTLDTLKHGFPNICHCQTCTKNNDEVMSFEI